MMIKKANNIEIPSIGLVFHLFDEFWIVNIKEKNNIEKVEIDVKKYYIDSPLIYPYFIEYDGKIIISKNSPEELKKILKEKFDIIEIDTIENLIGNLYIIGKNGIIYSRGKEKDIELISKRLSLPAYKIKAKYFAGSISKIYKDKMMISQELDDKTIEKIREISGYKIDVGSINFGSPYLRYGIEINKDYMILGKYTTGHEIVRIEEFFSD